MLEQLSGLLGTDDLSKWENEFVRHIIDVVAEEGCTTGLSGRQVEKIEQIWSKHFA